ncbi:hypothetical protein E2562_014359 [Oryza meyeriana var. granulata]|uniref:Uncharacterized protein n=1 Tax=Oryza meyeriana var. granulata TaxID=110450 RepID=A0A6G1C6E0_9ORYZ|nr:hypothetical protein E2562_014359 [Oryza meyeriana var. granulata]
MGWGKGSRRAVHAICKGEAFMRGFGDAAAVTAHLDTGVALLDACNAITVRLDRLRRHRLLSRFALHFLSSSPPPSSVRHIVFPLVSGNFPWTEAFNAVSIQLAALATKAGEVDAVNKAVRKLTSVLDSEGDLDEAALRAAAQEVEKRTEELTTPLDWLSD